MKNFLLFLPSCTLCGSLPVSLRRLLKPQQWGIRNMCHWGTDQGPEKWCLPTYVCKLCKHRFTGSHKLIHLSVFHHGQLLIFPLPEIKACYAFHSTYIADNFFRSFARKCTYTTIQLSNIQFSNFSIRWSV